MFIRAARSLAESCRRRIKLQFEFRNVANLRLHAKDSPKESVAPNNWIYDSRNKILP